MMLKNAALLTKKAHMRAIVDASEVQIQASPSHISICVVSVMCEISFVLSAKHMLGMCRAGRVCYRFIYFLSNEVGG